MTELSNALQALLVDLTPEQPGGGRRVPTSSKTEDEKFIAALWHSTETAVDFNDEFIDELIRPVIDAIRERQRLHGITPS
jgi:hypothetical protein